MADYVEVHPWPKPADLLLRRVLHAIEHQNVENVVNVLANALVIVTRAAGGEMPSLRKYINDMIDAHEAMYPSTNNPSG